MNFPCKVESGVQLLARLAGRPSLESFYPQLFSDRPRGKDIIEISYDINTHHAAVIYEIISKTLLPDTQNIEGKNAGVVFILTDGQFDFIQLLAVMNHKVKEKVKRYYQEDELENKVEEIISNSLKSFHILHVYDSHELSMAILNLENILSKHVNISLVLLDTIVAFYWSERLMHSSMTKMDAYLESVLKMFQKVTKEYNIVLLYTKPSYFVSANVGDHLESGIEDAEAQIKLDHINCRISLMRDMTDCGESVDEGNQRNLVHVKVATREKTILKYFVLSDMEIKWI